MTDDYNREMLEVYRRAHKAEENVRQFLADLDEDDTAIRDLCRPVLGGAAVDGDSHGVPPLVEKTHRDRGLSWTNTRDIIELIGVK